MEARADVTTDSREQLLAEAYCLRAFCSLRFNQSVCQMV